MGRDRENQVDGMLRRRVILLLVVLSLVRLAPAQAQRLATKPISFPEHSQAVSPNGRYLITNVESDSEPHHTVFLNDRRLKTRRKLFNYGRGIEILWNRDSKSFVLNDYAGSDYSECRIFSVDEKVQSINVWDQVLKDATTKERRSLLENHHVYIAAKEWISSKTLKVRVWGYGEVHDDGFTRYYLYEIGSGIRRYEP
jgi:hypothetical protein